LSSDIYELLKLKTTVRLLFEMRLPLHYVLMRLPYYIKSIVVETTTEIE